MKDHDLILYYIDKYQKERTKLNEQEILEYKNEINALFNNINMEQYTPQTQMLLQEFFNTFQLVVKDDINIIQAKAIQEQLAREKAIIEKEINLQKGQDKKDVEEELVESMPFGIGLLSPLQKAINKF